MKSFIQNLKVIFKLRLKTKIFKFILKVTFRCWLQLAQSTAAWNFYCNFSPMSASCPPFFSSLIRRPSDHFCYFRDRLTLKKASRRQENALNFIFFCKWIKKKLHNFLPFDFSLQFFFSPRRCAHLTLVVARNKWKIGIC